MPDIDTTKQFFRDLFGPGPFPGHGVRVNVKGQYDTNVLATGSLEERAQMGRRVFELDCRYAEEIGDDRVPMLHPWSGTEVFAAAFGCQIHRAVDNMPFALPAVHNAAEADRLEEPAIEGGPLGDIFWLCDRMLELCGPGFPVRICDVQSPFDISALIWEKSRFFVALVETPAAVHRLLQKVTDTMIRFLRAFKARYPDCCLVHYPNLWMPPEYGICLSEDDIGSISVRHFREFCLPYLQQLADAFGGISMHSCAHSQHQWDNFLRLPGLHYLNLFHPLTDFETSIAKFSGRAVLVPAWQPRDHDPLQDRVPGGGARETGGDTRIEFVRMALELARPDTRFFFETEAEDVAEARQVCREIKALCGRRSE